MKGINVLSLNFWYHIVLLCERRKVPRIARFSILDCSSLWHPAVASIGEVRMVLVQTGLLIVNSLQASTGKQAARYDTYGTTAASQEQQTRKKSKNVSRFLTSQCQTTNCCCTNTLHGSSYCIISGGVSERSTPCPSTTQHYARYEYLQFRIKPTRYLVL